MIGDGNANYICLTFAHPEHDPAEVTLATGIPPTWAKKVGDALYTSPEGSIVKCDESSWYFEVGGRFDREPDENDPFQVLLSRLETNKSTVALLREEWNAVMRFSIYPSSPVCSSQFTSETMRRLVELNLPIEVWTD